MIGQFVTYDGKEWKVSGVGHAGRKISGIWIKRHDRTAKGTETIEIYLKRKQLSKVQVIK